MKTQKTTTTTTECKNARCHLICQLKDLFEQQSEVLKKCRKRELAELDLLFAENNKALHELSEAKKNIILLEEKNSQQKETTPKN
jgi:hypothetical protein